MEKAGKWEDEEIEDRVRKGDENKELSADKRDRNIFTSSNVEMSSWWKLKYNMLNFSNGIKCCRCCSKIIIKGPDSSSQSPPWFALKANSNHFNSNDHVNPVRNYRQALRDELKAPKMRFYSERVVFEGYLPMVYKYYFHDCHYSIEQRKGTLNLAFNFFVQVCSRLKSLEQRDLNLLVLSCLMIASKLDEIDNNLPSFSYLIGHYSDSRYILQEISKLSGNS
jgi:hypothetical protein